MSRQRRIWMTGAAVALVVASVSPDRGLTLEVVDEQGRPVRDAYVAYHREGDLGPWMLVERIQYDATPPALARATDAGLAEIPGAWVWHWPMPIQMPPSIWVDVVYSPSLHNGFVSVGDRRFLKPEGPVVVVSPQRVRIELIDASPDAPQWLFTMGRLDDLVREFEHEPRARSEVVRHLGHEYDAFLDRHGGTPRPPLQEPRWDPWHTEDDKRKLREMIAQDQERYPTWGAYARERYGLMLEEYRRQVATMPP